MSPLPRYHKRRLNPIGKATERKRPVRRVEYEAVSRRAKGFCELCQQRQDPLDPHHSFGRGHLPGIPVEVCETRELILGICRRCHDAIHGGDQDLLVLARRKAMAQYVVSCGLGQVAVERFTGERLVDKMRQLIRETEERQRPDWDQAELDRERDHGAPI